MKKTDERSAGNRRMQEKKRRGMIIASVLCTLMLILGLAVLLINRKVCGSEDRIISEAEAGELKDVDCILVLGCSVREDGTPSAMLADRLDEGIRLFEAGVSDRLLMSGDHGQDDYDEVNTMKNYAVRHGIDPDCVFCDHAGFSTYDSLYRAKEIFRSGRIVIVTQRYHLSRALYIADHLGLDACGVSADSRTYRGQTLRDLREIAARCKDYFSCKFRPEPAYLGDPVPIYENGSISDG